MFREVMLERCRQVEMVFGCNFAMWRKKKEQTEEIHELGT